MVDEKNVDAVELERLRAENAELREKVAAADGADGVRNVRLRNGGAAAIMLIATMAVALAIPAVWVNRMVTSTDYYVSTVAPLARDAAIQDAVAGAAADAAVKELDLQTRIESRLPTDLAFLAAPISSAGDNFIRKQASAFVHSDAFPKVWDQVNRVSHQAFVTAVTGKQTGAVQVEAGTITLDLGVIVDKLVARLETAGLGFIENIPRTGALDKTITLYQSDTLAQMSSAVNFLQQVALVLPILGLALVAGAVAIAADRRKALLWLGWSLLAWTLLPLQVIYIGQGVVGAKLQSLASIPSDAAQNAYGIIFSQLVTMERLFVALALIVIVGALLAGPSRWATAVRRVFKGGIADVSGHLELGVFGEWVAARVKALRVAGYLGAAALLVVLPRPRTISQVWWVVGLLVVWLLMVQLFGSGASGVPSAGAAALDGESTPLDDEM